MMVECYVVYVCLFQALIPGGGGYSQKSLQFSLPYLWLHQKFDILFMTVALNISLLTVLLIMIKK